MSNYKTEQDEKNKQLREEGFFGDTTGEGHVLNNPEFNLLPDIRKDALDYFKKNDILWWKGKFEKYDKTKPTGSLVSSQVACANHLFPLRKRKELATALLKDIDPRVKEAVKVDDAFVEFEVIGNQSYLNEKEWGQRGANCTSLDAVMVGEKEDGKRILFVFEWKYTESPDGKEKDIEKIKTRHNRYTDILLKEQTAIKVPKPDDSDDIDNTFFSGPFCQPMRQTLLALKMVEAGEYNCDEYIHLHVIPKGNTLWDDVCEKWEKFLKEPKRYLRISPQDLFKPIEQEKDISDLITYLKKRYW